MLNRHNNNCPSRLLDIYVAYTRDFAIKINVEKTKLMYINSNSMHSFYHGNICLQNTVLNFCSKEKYLGHILSNNNRDDQVVINQISLYYCRANQQIRKFHFRTLEVKKCHFVTVSMVWPLGGILICRL